ncbi:hypothetical protein HYS92_00270 [Candidatus Daviesbacteria bacterium]|nr:hypothetical protein [Candidatus Daviesbacteria bacterium]
MSKPLKEKNIQIPGDILRKLLTPSEIRMLKNRFLILNFLKEGLSIRSIAEKVRVGTDTVVRTIRLIEEAGLRNRGNSKTRKIKSSIPWIFGKINE